eukprot:Partr_v1_DN27898_c0_g1_i1_m22555 putative Ribosomal protein
MFSRISLLRTVPRVSNPSVLVTNSTSRFIRPASILSSYPYRSSDGLKSFFAGNKNTIDHWSSGMANTGRPWDVNLLRTKSWEDLHKLWIVLLRERNMLYTRLKDQENNPNYTHNPIGNNLRKVRESMRGVKIVVNERWTAWNG